MLKEFRMGKAQRAGLLVIILLAGCSGKPATTETGGGRDQSQPKVVRIVFDLPGDDIGSPESRALLEKVKAGIQAQAGAEIVSSGFGMGNMEVVVRYDGDESMQRIRNAIDSAAPTARYRVEQTAP
jgi:hypothetical protein